MYAKSTANFVEGARGEQAEIRVELMPRDSHQHDLLSQLILKGGNIEREGGRFVITLNLGLPNPNYARPSQSVSEKDDEE